MSAKLGADTWRIGGAVGSPIHRIFRARIEGKRTHQANGKPRSPAGLVGGKLSLKLCKPSGTAAGAPLHTTCWGLLKQPDNQKTPS